MKSNFNGNLDKVKNFFFEESKLEKIKNVCFNKETIKRMEKTIKELKKELKKMKFECHNVKDSHFGIMKEQTEETIMLVSKILKELKLEKKKSKSSFNIKPCCDIYEELEDKIRFIKTNILSIESSLQIGENIEAEEFNKRFTFGQFENLSLDEARKKKEESHAVTKEIYNKIDEFFKTFQEEQKEKEKEFKQEKKKIKERIEKLEDEIFGISKRAPGSSLYYNLKLEVHNLTLNLLRAEIEHEKNKKTKKIVGGILIGVGILSLLVLTAPVSGFLAGLFATTTLTVKTGVLAGGAISATGGTALLVNDYLNNKKRGEEIEELKNDIQQDIEPTKIKESETIDEEIDTMKEMIIKLEEAYNKCVKNKVDIDNEDINNEKKKFNKAVLEFEVNCMNINI